MSGKTRAFFLSLSIVALLVFSAVGTIPVYADDGTTTGSTDTTTTTGTDQGDTSTTDEQAVDTTTTDASPTGDQAVDTTTTDTSATGEQPADAAVTADVPTEAVTAPLLEQLPENTTVTVVDATGEAQPLAAQDSADAVLLSDPIWCPAGQAPTPGANGCTESFTSFTLLLTYLEANDGNTDYQKDGTIYVQQGAYLGGEDVIDFNSYNLTNLSQKNLKVQGGWDTVDNSVDPADTSQFTVPIIVGSSSNPWVGSLTFNNIIINGVDGQTGLTLYSEGDINLTNVQVTDSQAGADLNAGGNVTIKDSKFNNNQKAGAKVKSDGNVEISNTQASGNHSSTYNNGWQYEGVGLDVITSQDITLNNIIANGNLFGAYLQGADVTLSNSTFSVNTSGWDDPVGYGVKVKSSGAVTLNSVAANSNQLFGADIEAGSSVLISNSFFNGNQSFYWSGDKTYYGYGLQVSTIADIALLTVAANGNYVLGAHLEGSSITVRDSVFNNNSSGSGLDLIGKGLEIVGITVPLYGDGDVALRNVTADNNQLFGANIQTTGDVAIRADTGQTSSFSGHIVYVYDANSGAVSEIGGGYGLQIVAGGNIDLIGVTTTGNYLYGTSLDGLDVAIADGVFSNNGSGVNTLPVGYGLNLKSKGTVSILNITANNNQFYGADIAAIGNISITTGFFSGHQAVVAVPCKGLTFYGYGLTAKSETGDVTLDGVEANFNNLWGASLDGLSVFVVNSKFNNNVSDSSQFIDDTGLIVNSRGDFVLLENVEAKENRLIGATITAVGDVYVINSTFTGNAGVTCSISWCPAGSQIYWGYGLNVVTPGLIYLDGVNASDNNLFGANLEGSTVTVLNSTFNNNSRGDGLIINATGDVTLTNVTTTGNENNGADVTTGACAVVLADGGTYTTNGQYDLSVTGGTLTQSNSPVIGNLFQNPSTCVIVLSAPLAASNVVLAAANSNTSNTTTVSANTTSDNKTVKHNKKTAKAKKAHAKKHKVTKKAKIRLAKRGR